MELITTQRIYYSNREHIPLGEIADSLLALDELIHQTPDVLENLFPGANIYRVEVYLNELKSGSLYEDVIVKFLFGNQEKLDEFIKNSRERIGLQYLQDNNHLLSAILLVLILTGGAYYYGKGSARSEDKATLEANNDVVINVGANLLNMSPDEFQSAVVSGIKDKDKLAQHASRFVKPAKRDGDAHIRFDDAKELQVNSDSIKAMPSHIIDPDPEESAEDYDHVEVVIRAIDLDSHRKGWAAIIPDISDRRVKLQLDPHIDGETLMQHPAAIANVTAVFKADKEGNKLPTLYFLRDIHEFTKGTP
ncbi:MAG TPA: hypothetical protein VFK88_12460 [Gallionella sp.]|nr:hypothetical protein [Gallionella sp.]